MGYLHPTPASLAACLGLAVTLTAGALQEQQRPRRTLARPSFAYSLLNLLHSFFVLGHSSLPFYEPDASIRRALVYFYMQSLVFSVVDS